MDTIAKSGRIRLLAIAFVCLTSLHVHGFGQTTKSGNQKADTLISMAGRVLDAETKEPVMAEIIFHRLPYGGNVGASKVKNSDGDYHLTLMRSYEYTVTLKADGYLPVNEVIETQDPSRIGNIDRDFYLVPTGVGQTLRLKSLIFEQSKNEIPKTSYAELDQLAIIMKKNPNMIIQLEGHTDYKGRASLNMQLSQSRVEAVKNYLIAKGIKAKKIKLKAFGGSQPISHDLSDEARSVNRRVEVRILKN